MKTALGKLGSVLGLVLKNRWVFRGFGIALFIIILTKIDLGEAWRTLTTIDLRFLVLSFVFQMIGMAIATLRWQMIMGVLGIRLSLARAFLYQIIGTAAALVTPGELGELAKAWYVRRAGFPTAEALFSVLLDRACDLLLLLFFGFVAVAYLFGASAALSIALAIVGSLGLVSVFFILKEREQARKRLALVFAKASPKAYRSIVETDANHLLAKISAFDRYAMFLIGLATIGNYVFLLLRIYAVLPALHVSVPFWYFVMVVPVLRLVGFIPISVSGIGTRDVTTIYLLGKVGVPDHSSLLLSTLGLITLQAQALIGLVAWWLDSLQWRRWRVKAPAPAETATQVVTPSQCELEAK